MSDDIKTILKEGYMIMAVIAVIADILLAVFWGGSPLYWDRTKAGILIGVAAGCVLGMYLFLDMSRSVERCLELDGESAKKYIFRSYTKRLLIIFVAMLIFSFTDGWVNVVAALGGIFCLKPAAYLQPWLHKKLQKG